MKYVYFFLISIYFTTTFSQQSGIVEYKYSYNPNIGKRPTDYIKYKAIGTVDKAAEYAKEHKYILKFNRNESFFYIEEGLQADNVEDPLAYGLSKMIMGKGIYYQNKKNKYQLNQKESLHKLYLVKDTIKSDWILTYEKKTILGYKCYKAKKKCKCGKNIIIWYTPEIPVPFGPAGYNGAPGLILEVTFFKHTLKAKKINLLNKDLKINPPTEGEPITKVKLENRMWNKKMELMEKYRR